MASVKPKKHLGQHFLIDKSIAADIVSALVVSPAMEVLEIGPGTGVLTDGLLKKDFAKFLAMDLDNESIAFLKKTYPNHANKFIY